MPALPKSPGPEDYHFQKLCRLLMPHIGVHLASQGAGLAQEPRREGRFRKLTSSANKERGTNSISPRLKENFPGRKMRTYRIT
jgi:hypothetical protein